MRREEQEERGGPCRIISSLTLSLSWFFANKALVTGRLVQSANFVHKHGSEGANMLTKPDAFFSWTHSQMTLPSLLWLNGARWLSAGQWMMSTSDVMLLRQAHRTFGLTLPSLSTPWCGFRVDTQDELGSHALKVEARSSNDSGEQWGEKHPSLCLAPRLWGCCCRS